MLEKRTGEEHRTADLATGDLLASVIGHFQPADLRTALGDVLGVEWRQSEGVPGYTAVRTGESRRVEAAVVSSRAQALRAGLRNLALAAALPLNEQHTLPRELARSLDSPAKRAAAEVLLAISRADQEALLAGVPSVIPFTALSPAGREKAGAWLSVGLPGTEPPGDALDRTSLTIRSSELSGVPGIELIELSAVQAGQTKLTSLISIPIETRVVETRLPRKGTPAGDGKMPGGFGPVQTDWESILTHLSKVIGRPIVSDAFRFQKLFCAFSGTSVAGEPIEEFLSRACANGWHHRWGSVGSILTFQHEDWPVLRSRQIPEHLVERWRQHLIDQSRITLEDASLAATLRPAQTAILHRVLGSELSRSLTLHRSMLDLWNALDRRLRDKALAGGFLHRDLPLGSQHLARELLSSLNSNVGVRELANSRFGFRTTDDGLALLVKLPDQDAIRRDLPLIASPEQLRQQALKRALNGPDPARPAAILATGLVGVPANWDSVNRVLVSL